MSNENIRKSSRIKARKKTSYLEDDFEYDYDIDQEISSLLDSNHNNNNDEKMTNRKKSLLQNSHKTKSKINRENKKQHETEEGINNEHFKDGAAKNKIDVGSKNMHEKKLTNPLGSMDQKPEQDSHKHEHQEKGKNSGGCYICHACNRICADEASYEKHMKSHSGNRQFKCNLCEKSFMESCSLKRHMKTHDDDRPYPCDLCFKSFRDSASLIRHQRTHSERPKMFQCSRCDKSFTDKHGLKRHERIHTGLRPYQCKICLKTFSESGSFKRHQKIHTGVRNFVCMKCGKCFLEKQSLVRHQKNVCGFGDGLITMASIQHNSFDLDHSRDSLYSGAEHSEGSIDDRGTSLTDSQKVQDALPVKKEHIPFAPPIVNENDNACAIKEKQGSPNDPPSLHSLIQKDPNLYNSISSIVESIDSYEKLLDLCSDKGQCEIEKALKCGKPSEMPENLMCFECGEPLVDEENFKSEDKCFISARQNSFKCISCEEGDNYGDPPVLTAEVELEKSLPLNDARDCDEEASYDPVEVSSQTKNVFGSDETIEHLRERLKSQHGVYFIGEEYNSPSIDKESNVGNETNTFSTEAPCLEINESDHGYENLLNDGETHKTMKDVTLEDHSTSKDESGNTDSVLPPPDLIKATDDDISEQQKSLMQLEYEADDPSIPSVFPCHLCTKVFASGSFLSQHLDLHKRYPHKCMVCGRTFKNSASLKRHMRTHTGEKPYSCAFCEKSFRDPSNFSKHKKVCHPFDTMPSSADSTSPTSSSSQYSTDDPSDNASTGAYLADLKRKLNFQPTLTPTVPKSPSSQSVQLFECGFDNDGEEDDSEEDDDIPLIFGVASQEEPSVKLELKNGKDTNVSLTVGETVVKKENIESVPVLCNICSKSFKNEQCLEMHMNYHTGNPNLTCIECGKSFSDSFSLKRHTRIHADTRPYMCAYCKRGYCDNWSLKKHQSRGCTIGELKVPADFLHPCPQCIRVFAEADFLLEHLKTHKGLLKFECDICLKRFSEAFNLKQHHRLHMAVCPGCEREFKDKKALSEHQLQDCPAVLQGEATNPDEGFSCPECGRIYSTKAYLERHKKFHSDLKPHVCEVCQKRFSEAFRLKRHLKVHTYIKPYTCEGCKKGFTDVSGLRRHIAKTACKVHKEQLKNFTRREVNDYPCAICDKVFLKNYLLVRHMNVHSQDRPFACDVCERSYKDTSSLKRHQLVHQGIKNFICSVCSKDFYYADSLKRHMSGSCGKKGKSQFCRKAKGRKAKSNNNINIKNKNTLIMKNDISPEREERKELNGEKGLIISDSKPRGIPNVKKHHSISCFSKNVTLNPQYSHVSIKLIPNLKFQKHSSARKNEKHFKCSKCFAGFSKKMYLTIHDKVHQANPGSKQQK